LKESVLYTEGSINGRTFVNETVIIYPNDTKIFKKVTEMGSRITGIAVRAR
jgi:hypothetical protein